MIKTKSKIIVLAVIMIFGAGVVFAQAIGPESNSSLSTFGEIGTDVDNFFDTTGYQDLELENIFLYSRFGANIPDARLDLGAAVNIGSLYLGLYYKGGIAGNKEGPSRNGEYYLADPNPGSDATTPMKWSARSKANPNADYGVLVGIGGMGFKFTYQDYLSIDNSGMSASGQTVQETLTGQAIPSIEAGLNLGPLSKVGLSFTIEHNRETEIFHSGILGYVSYSNADTLNGTAISGTTAATVDNILEAEGNYLQPDLYVKLDMSKIGIDGFTIENNLRFRFFGLPKIGESETLAGVGYIETIHDVYNYSGNSSSTMSVYDKRGWFEDVITPSYNFTNAGSGDEDAGQKFTYSATVALPISIKILTNSLSASYTSASFPASNYTADAFYQKSTFSLGIAPALSAGVKYQLAKPFSVHAGISAELFSITLDAETEKDAGYSQAQQDALTLLGGGWVNYLLSGDSKNTSTTFTYPKVSLGAGFTISLFDKAELDFAIVYYMNPTAAGTIYKAVGDGLGSGDTSIVLSLKF